VLAVPLPRRPLFPAGNRLPVTVTDKKLIAEIVDLQRGGRASTLPCAPRPVASPQPAAAERSTLCPCAQPGLHLPPLPARACALQSAL
jgi:hypothetical protein